MPSNYTPNYNLNQWEPGDAVLRSDFNADNAKLDAALTALSRQEAGKADQSALDAEAAARKALGDTVAAHTAAIAKLGNCMIVSRSYTGTGGTCVQEFNHRVLAVFVFGGYSRFSAVRGSSHGAGWAGQTFSAGTVRWSGNTVSWSGTEAVAGMCNESGQTYHLVALLDAAN